MDYDKTDIATNYDKARALEPETVRLWRDLLSTSIDRATISRIIDLGCGTGRFSELLATHFGVEVIGIDPSQTMVDQALRKPATEGVTYRRGSAEALPLPNSCADLVFLSNVYHHIGDPLAAARECHRVLRPGGYVCVRNGTRETDFPQRHSFPALQALLDSEIPTRREIASVFATAGFTPVVNQIVTQTIAPDWRSFVEKTALRADSLLTRLSDKDFQRGMAALRAHGEGIDQEAPVNEEIAWFVFRA